MSKLNKIDKYFLEDPSRMQRGSKITATRLKVTESEVIASRKKVKSLQSAETFINKLEETGMSNLDEVVKTVSKQDPKKAEVYELDMVRRKCESKTKETEDKYKALLNQYEALDNKYDDLLRLQDQPKVSKLSIPLDKTVKRQGASLIAVSDWHVEKIIEKRSLNGLNEFNPTIAKLRSEKFADSTVKLINRDSVDFDKHSTVLFLNGDFIEGYIHPESQMITNSMTPVEATAFANELISNALTHIIKNAKTKDITIVCQNGNHARTSKRMESSTDHRTSYETMLYAMLNQKFKDSTNFILPYSDVSYVKIMDKNIRYFHGHQCKFGGGIGGLTVPLTKFILRQNSVNSADYNIMGHYHTASLPTVDCMLNGSLCGYDNYAQMLGCSYEPAMQTYRLLDSKYGFTSFNPIICE